MELELSLWARDAVQETWREKSMCWGWGSLDERECYRPAASAGPRFLRLPCVGMKAKKLSLQCGTPRARKYLWWLFPRLSGESLIRIVGGVFLRDSWLGPRSVKGGGRMYTTYMNP